MPLSEIDKLQVSAFLGGLVRGTAEVGFAALPLLKLYKVAKEERVSLPDLLARDPETVLEIIAALRRQARKLPPSVIKALEQVVIAAKADA